MNQAEARLLLMRPLVFGSSDQIEAVNYLSHLEYLRETGEGDECVECEGSGLVICRCCANQTECEACDGSGFELVDVRERKRDPRQLSLFMIFEPHEISDAVH